MNSGRIGRTTQEGATAIVDAALQAGTNLIDTADAYSRGRSEEMVGKAVAGRRDDYAALRHHRPGQRARLAAVEQLAGVAAGAGLTLIQLALGCVTRIRP